MNTPKPQRPKRVSLRTPEGGTVILDFEEQAALWLRRGDPQPAIDLLRPLVSADLHAAITDTLKRGLQRKRGRPPRDRIEESVREADDMKAELVRNVLLPREQAMAKLRRRLKGAPSPVEVANTAAAETIGRKPDTYARDRRRKSGKK